MKTNLNFGIVLFVLFSCSALRRDVSADRIGTKSSRQLQYQDHLNWQTFVIRDDSSLNETIVQLVPQGRFKFSPITGFEGKASSLQIIGKTKQVSQERKQEQLQYQTRFDAKSEDAMQQSGKTVATKRVSFVWAGIGILILLSAWLAYRYW